MARRVGFTHWKAHPRSPIMRRPMPTAKTTLPPAMTKTAPPNKRLALRGAIRQQPQLDPAVCDWISNDRSGAARALGRNGRTAARSEMSPVVVSPPRWALDWAPGPLRAGGLIVGKLSKQEWTIRGRRRLSSRCNLQGRRRWSAPPRCCPVDGKPSGRNATPRVGFGYSAGRASPRRYR